MEKTTRKEKLYSANEICNIIKTCSKNGVTNIKISGIEVNFKDHGNDPANPGMTWPKPTAISKKLDNTPLEALELNENDLEEIKQLELAQQAIDDPVGFEQGVINQFIDGEVDEANGYS